MSAATNVIMAGDDASFESELYGGMVGLAMRGWLDYKKRVIDVLCAPDKPFILVWLLRTVDVSVDSGHRRRVANDILHGAGGDLCAKLLKTHAMRECLMFTSSSGASMASIT